MKIESHRESFKEHREAIFDWAVSIKGLAEAQRIVGTHASRGIVDLLAIYLLKRNITKPFGFVLHLKTSRTFGS